MRFPFFQYKPDLLRNDTPGAHSTAILKREYFQATPVFFPLVSERSFSHLLQPSATPVNNNKQRSSNVPPLPQPTAQQRSSTFTYANVTFVNV